MNPLGVLDSGVSLQLTVTLLHFLWQGCAVGLLVFATGWTLRRAPANVRYAINVAALMLMAACLPVTFALVYSSPPELEVGSVHIEAGVASPARIPIALPLNDEIADSCDGLRMDAAIDELTESPSSGEPEPTLAETNVSLGGEAPTRPSSARERAAGHLLSILTPCAPYVTTVYFLGVVVMLFRLARALCGGHRLRQNSTPVDDENVSCMIRRQTRHMGMRAAPAVAWCQRVSVPLTVGIVKPVILLPASLAAGLAPTQLEAIVTHELAHIRRYDSVINLLQRLIEAVLFFHPAVWYVSRQVSIERETACDDSVLSAGWQRLQYAEALVRMAELCAVGRGVNAVNQVAGLAASGGSPSQFKRRVLRLLGDEDQPRLWMTRSRVLLVWILMLSVFATASVVRIVADDAETQRVPDRESLSANRLPDRNVAAGRKPSGSAAPDGLRRAAESVTHLRTSPETTAVDEHSDSLTPPLVAPDAAKIGATPQRRQEVEFHRYSHTLARQPRTAVSSANRSGELRQTMRITPKSVTIALDEDHAKAMRKEGAQDGILLTCRHSKHYRKSPNVTCVQCSDVEFVVATGMCGFTKGVLIYESSDQLILLDGSDEEPVTLFFGEDAQYSFSGKIVAENAIINLRNSTVKVDKGRTVGAGELKTVAPIKAASQPDKASGNQDSPTSPPIEKPETDSPQSHKIKPRTIDDGSLTQVGDGKRDDTPPTVTKNSEVITLRAASVQRDVDRLQGAWRMVSEEANGEVQAVADPNRQHEWLRVVFEKDLVTGPYSQATAVPAKLQMELEASKSPKRMRLSLRLNGETRLVRNYLYRFRTDGKEELELCFDKQKSDRIPAGFNVGDANVISWIFEREPQGDELAGGAVLAWNRTDKYVPPDFEGYFPDDEEGGKRLDAYVEGKLDRNLKPEEKFEIVRRGLRRTKHHKTLILARIGNGFVWNKSPQHPLAIELLYHASASPDRANTGHYAMYHGPTVVAKRSDNLLRMLMEQYHSWSGSIQHRIHWGLETYGDQQDTAARLQKLLDQYEELDESTVLATHEAYRELTGKLPPRPERFTDIGQWTVAFHHRDVLASGSRGHESLREMLHKDLEAEDKVIDFVTRLNGDYWVGVALVKGIAERDRLVTRIEHLKGFESDFAELLTPQVLRRRRLREFAKYLPDGLPPHAKPVYTPRPLDETYAFNRTDRFEPPNYAQFFPDDPAAGKQLDELYASREHLTQTDREILEIFRRGFRRTSLQPNLLVSWIAVALGWPADPYQREIFYHLADPRAPLEVSYTAVYFGMNPSLEKTDNELQNLHSLFVSPPVDRGLAHNLRGRILWCIRNSDREKQFLAERFAEMLAAPNLEQLPVRKLALLDGAYRQLTDKNPPSRELYDRRGLFVVGFRRSGVRTTAELREKLVEQFGQSEHWVDVAVRQQDQEISAIVLVRGLAGQAWLIEEIQKDGGYALDYAGLLDAEIVKRGAVPEFGKYLNDE